MICFKQLNQQQKQLHNSWHSFWFHNISALPSCLLTGHCSVYSVQLGRWSTTAYASTGVPAHLISVLLVRSGRSSLGIIIHIPLDEHHYSRVDKSWCWPKKNAPIVFLYDTVFLFLVLYQVFIMNLLKPDVPSALKISFQVSETLMRRTKGFIF